MEPIRVRNLNIQNTVVRLHPGQSLILEFTDPDSILDVDFDSVFFDLEKEQTVVENTSNVSAFIKEYHFTQKFDLTDWSNISAMYMGEIFVLRQENVMSICVILDSKHQRPTDVLTVMNPSNTCLKLRPSQILEVVVFDPNKGEPTRWDVKISVGVYQLKYQQIKHSIVNPRNFNPKDFLHDPLVPYPRVQDAEMEHHFWFKSCYMQNGFNPAWPPGLYDGGKIVFSGKSQSGKILSNAVKVNLRVKKNSRGYPIIFKPKKSIYPLCEDVDIEEKQITDPWDGCRILEGEVRSKKNRPVVICDESYD